MNYIELKQQYARNLRATRDERLGTTADERELARRVANAPSHVPVKVVKGWKRPSVHGDGYYWTTPGGNICHYPHAYQKACGNPIYHASTIRVEVGRLWLDSRT